MISAYEVETPKSFIIELDRVPIKNDDVVGPKSEGMATTEIQVAYEHKYMGYIYVGSSQQAVNVTFDTSSPYLAITSELCGNCETKAFSQSKSISAVDIGD